MLQKNKKYILACDFELMKAEEIFAEKELKADPALVDGYVIYDHLYEKPYLINQSIYYFLEYFKDPNDFHAAMNSIGVEKEQQIDSESYLLEFFSGLVEKGILVSPKANKKIEKEIEKEKEQPEINIQNYTTLKVFKQTQNLWVGLVENELDKQAPIVIKKLIFDKEGKDAEADKKEFFQEFEILKEVNSHPSICKLLFIDYENCQAGLEYIKGESLRSYILKKTPDLTDRIRLINILLDVFSFLHQTGVIHGDIHASNFMLDEDSNLKLIDFGLSNHARLKKEEFLKRGAAHYYVPPERVSTNPFKIINKQKTDYPSENYQLGIIMYYILYGKTPHDALTWNALSKDILEKPVEFASHTSMGECIATDLLRILEKTLQKDPKKRYQTAAELEAEWKRKIYNL